MSPRNVPLPHSRATSPEGGIRSPSRAASRGRLEATDASVDQWTALLDGILKATGTTYSTSSLTDSSSIPVSQSKRGPSRPVTPASTSLSRSVPPSRAATPVQRTMSPAVKVVMGLEAMMKPLFIPERDSTKGVNGEMAVMVSTETEVRDDQKEIVDTANNPRDDTWTHLVVEDKV